MKSLKLSYIGKNIILIFAIIQISNINTDKSQSKNPDMMMSQGMSLAAMPMAMVT